MVELREVQGMRYYSYFRDIKIVIEVNNVLQMEGVP